MQLFAALSFFFSCSCVALASSSFAADSSIDVSAIYAAAKKSASKAVTSFAAEQGQSKDVTIYSDWLHLDGVSAYHFMADMDIDCDGVSFECPGNTDGQDETSFGALDANKVPYYVLPLSFTESHKDIKPNSVGAIICDGKMFYGIYGDQNGDTPELIGEASISLAKACFPNDHISGNNGHGPRDVLYIVFGSAVPSGVGHTTIDIGALKTLGDKQTKALQSALDVGSSSSGGKAVANSGSNPQSGSNSHPSKTNSTTTITTTSTSASHKPSSSSCQARSHSKRNHKRRMLKMSSRHLS